MLGFRARNLKKNQEQKKFVFSNKVNHNRCRLNNTDSKTNDIMNLNEPAEKVPTETLKNTDPKQCQTAFYKKFKRNEMLF